MKPIANGTGRARPLALLSLTALAATLHGCSARPPAPPAPDPAPQPAAPPAAADAGPAVAAQAAHPSGLRVNPPTPDPRVGLEPGMFDAGEAIWNLRMLSTTPPPEEFVGTTNSDLAFTGNHAIQGNYDGIQVWGHLRSAQSEDGLHLRVSGLAERCLGLRQPALRVR